MTKPLLSLFNKNQPQPFIPPIWFMRQAGRYLPEYRQLRSSFPNFMDLCYHPQAACEVTLQPIDRFHLDAAIIFSDILVIPDALGQKVSFKKDHGPVLALLGEEFLSSPFDEVAFKKHLAPVYEAIKLTKQKLSSSTTLIGFAGAPWTLATYMIEQGKTRTFSNALQWLAHKESAFDFLVNRLVEAIISHVEGQVEAGAEVIQIFDSWAKVVPSPFVEKAIIKPMRTLLQRLRKLYPTLPIIYFCKERADLYLYILKDLPFMVAGIDQFADLDWVQKTIQPKFIIQGNLCPQLLVQGGDPLIQRVDEILKKWSKKPFIFNLGHGILPHTPLNHVQRVIDHIRTKVYPL